MDTNVKNLFWNQAAKCGLMLGAVSALYLGITHLTSLIQASGFAAILTGLLNALLWVAKFAGCIYLLRMFIFRYSDTAASAGEESRMPSAFAFGALTAFFSALLYSAVYMAYQMYIVPDLFESVMELYKTMPQMTGEVLDAFERIEPKLPSIMFFSNLIYCTLFGVIVSAIVSKKTNSSDPFMK